MNIVVLQGSPNRNGSSNLLAESFRQGALVAHYKTLVRYLNLTDMGMVLGYGCGTPAMTRRSPFPQKAYELGNKLK